MIVFTVDHGLRADSVQEAAQVGEWARASGLEHDVLAWRGSKPKSDVQAAAREARYRLLAEACAARGLSHLVTAHHLNDQAETVLMRLARGSGVDGLAAMSKQTDRPGLKIVRPFLDVPKDRLVATLRAIGQSWIEDPSNGDTRFARARLRSQMPALAREGMTAERLAQTAVRMRRARLALETAAAELHLSIVHEDPAGFCHFDRREWSRAPEEIGLRVLVRLLMGIGGTDYPPRLERLERLYERLASAREADGAVTLNGCRIIRSDTKALVFRETGRGGLPSVALAARRPVIWDQRFRIEAAGRPPDGLVVRALGTDGVSTIRRESTLRDIPLAAARVAPGVFRDNKLLSAPLVEAGPGPYSSCDFSFSFVGSSRFAGSASAGSGPE